jgi:hypothetical protein
VPIEKQQKQKKKKKKQNMGGTPVLRVKNVECPSFELVA